MFTLPVGQSTRARPFLATAGACQSGRQAVPTRAISRGQCAQERPGWLLPRAPRAGGWSRRACRHAALLVSSDRRSPLPVRRAGWCAQSSGITSLRVPRASDSVRLRCAHVSRLVSGRVYARYVQTHARSGETRRPLRRSRSVTALGSRGTPASTRDLDRAPSHGQFAKTPVKGRSCHSG